MKENENNNQPNQVAAGNNLSLLAVENLIHVVRGQQIMIDSDLAQLYGVETRILNQAVKRNLERFPEDFMFRLTKEEAQSLKSGFQASNQKSQNMTSRSRSQIVTLNMERGKNIKYLPYAFTENGVAMLSSVLRSKTAIDVNIRIMRAFTSMRSFLMNNAHVFQRLETIEHNYLLVNNRLSEHDRKFDEVLARLDTKIAEPIEGFFFEGQIFDAYSLISDLVRKAEKRIVLIDNYVDDRVLKVLAKRKDGVSTTIYTDPRHSQISTDLKRYNAQYPRIVVKDCNNVHDRFLIIDETVYFIGGSIKDLGKKIVAFSQMHQNPDKILTRLR